MKLDFSEIDVFTSVPLMGNPVAVVHDAAGLSTEQMGRIANWTNFSETTFVTGVASESYDVRIFTPKGELPFAGHPSVGTAFALRSRGRFSPGLSRLTQNCAAGPIAVRFEDERVRVRVPEARITEVSTARTELLQALAVSELHHPARINLGPVWIIARIPWEHLEGMQPSDTHVVRVSQELGATGITVYAASGNAVAVRSFAPAAGIKEDPVCGSGNAAVAAHLRHTGGLGETGFSYVARQGTSLGRDGQVHVTVDGDEIWIGGFCAEVVRGTLNL
ncbi:MAG: PhzF family phenazine biosynthesis protein [Myxococcota bacterium]